MPKSLILILGLLVFAASGYWCVYIKLAPKIQNDIQSRVSRALNHAGYSFVDLDVNGRDVTLRGKTADASTRGKVDAVVKQVKGVRLVSNEIILGNTAQDYSLEIDNQSGELVITGMMPDTRSHHNLVNHLMEAFPNKTISDQLVEEAGLPDYWIQLTKSGLNGLKKLQSGKLIVTPDTVYLSGTAPSATLRDQVIATLSSELDKALPAENHTNLLKKISFKPHISLSSSTEPDTAKPQHKTADHISVNKSASVSQKIDTKPHALTACQQNISRLMATNSISFKSGAVALTKDTNQVLNSLSKVLLNCDTFNVLVKGHTDSQGDKSLNQALSQKRAESVKRFFVSKGIKQERIKAIGVGDDEPIATNATAAGRQKNRRIEIKIIEEAN